MSREYITIGPVPSDEDCAQVGAADYRERARRETRGFIEAIRKTVGVEPDNASLIVKAFPHDFGTYHEVVCYYDTDDKESMNYAFRCEAQAPRNWTEAGMVAP